jgi:hypothetical protein
VRLMPARPFRVFGFAARTSVSPPWFVLSQGWLFVQSYRPLRYRRYGFDDPTVPLVHFLGCVVFPERTLLITVKQSTNPLVELGLPFRVLPSVS